jgi:hypothetical protein
MAKRVRTGGLSDTYGPQRGISDKLPQRQQEIR